MKTYVKIWRSGNDDNEPKILESIESIKAGDLFQTVENLNSGPILFATCDSYRDDSGKLKIKTDTIPF